LKGERRGDGTGKKSAIKSAGRWEDGYSGQEKGKEERGMKKGPCPIGSLEHAVHTSHQTEKRTKSEPPKR